jgi:phage-related holin
MMKELFFLILKYVKIIWNSNALDWVFAAIGSFVAAYIFPVQTYILLSLGLCVADQITGVMAAKKSGEKIISSKLRRTFEKLLVYVVALAIVHAFEQVVLFDLIGEAKPLTWLVIFSISIHELQSIMENVSTVTNVDLWSVLKKKIFGLINLKK